jgi:hypothetical protein
LLLRNACHFRKAAKAHFDIAREGLRPNTQTGQQRRHNAVVLGYKRGQQMQRLDLLMVMPCGDVLCRLNGFLRFECEFVEADHLLVPLSSYLSKNPATTSLLTLLLVGKGKPYRE